MKFTIAIIFYIIYTPDLSNNFYGNNRKCMANMPSRTTSKSISIPMIAFAPRLPALDSISSMENCLACASFSS